MQVVDYGLLCIVAKREVAALILAQTYRRVGYALLQSNAPVFPDVAGLTVQISKTEIKLFFILNRWILKRFHYLCGIFKGLGGDCLRI